MTLFSIFRLMAVVLSVAALTHAALPTFPNIGYLGSGYDIMLGNPHPTNDVIVDPGFRRAVFDLTRYNGSLTPDQRYQVPTHVEVQGCQTCSLSFSSLDITGSSAYFSSLEQSVSASFEGWGAAFSASVDYKTVKNHTEYYHDIYVKSKAVCSEYCPSLGTFDTPAFTSNFRAAVDYLPVNFSGSAYGKFLDEFGTHVTTALVMGGSFGQQSVFTNKNWTNMVSTGLNVNVAASYSGFGASGKVVSMTDSQRQEAATFAQFSSSQSIFSVGGHPPADGNVTLWAANVVKDPMPIRYTLTPMSNFLSDHHFPQDTHIAAKHANMVKALSGYCPYLITKKLVTSCSAPGKDPPLPSPHMCTGSIGPFGNSSFAGGQNFDDGYSTSHLNKKTRVVAVHYRTGNSVDNLQLELSDGNSTWLNPPHGGNGGNSFKWVVPDYNYITQIELWYENRINSIQFHTNKGNASPRYGSYGGTHILATLPGKDSIRLVGLFGRTDNIIIQLGFHYAYEC